MADFNSKDLLLWNSFMGKAYSVSDCFKENGIGILAKACKDEGFDFIIEDPAKIEFYRSFTENNLSKKLSELCEIIFSGKSREELKPFVRGWNILQDELSGIIKKKMETYIAGIAEKVRCHKVKVLGIKTWLGDRFSYSEELTRRVNKISPDTIVIAGGPQVNQFKMSTMEKSPFDFCIDVEGEEPLVKIIHVVKDMYSQGYKKSDVIDKITTLARGGEICNILYRDENVVKSSPIKRVPLSLKTFPWYEKEDGKVDIAVITESSGCYYGKCNFCTHPNITGKYQSRDIAKTLEEIKHTIKEMDIGLFRFAGSTTPVSLSKKIANALLEEGIKIEYSMFVRAENRARDKFEKLVADYEKIICSGLKAVFLGAEVANDRILSQIMEKGNSVEDIYYTIKALKQASYNTGKHLDVGVSFVYPCPLPFSNGINHEKVLEEDLSFLKKLKDENYMPDSVLITPGAPLPGTMWYLKHEKFGFDLPEDYLQVLLRYEYELTKDPSTWPQLNISLNGIKFLDMLKMTGLMEKKVKEMGYTVNVSDEHCLAARSAGFFGKKGLEEFKIKSDIALMTTNYDFLRDVYQKINNYSKYLAKKNSL
ncbi:MAG: hypothetical protein E3K37_07995 [Candidatus Kuenenia sp.]|nr:hypothetical protein [Candidatus Kuenenia hertensis]